MARPFSQLDGGGPVRPLTSGSLTAMAWTGKARSTIMTTPHRHALGRMFFLLTERTVAEAVKPKRGWSPHARAATGGVSQPPPPAGRAGARAGAAPPAARPRSRVPPRGATAQHTLPRDPDEAPPFFAVPAARRAATGGHAASAARPAAAAGP